ncbi:MAG: hypothetical protein ACR2LT_05350 [Pyrinomonadaceae bacterium]
MKTVIVQWSGAFSYEQVCDSDKGNGIYLLTGKKKHERNYQIQYCGITEDYFCNRINRNHHKLTKIKNDTLSIWLGEIIYPDRFNRNLLELAEHCFVSFWLPELNDRKTVYYPKYSICFISQWFNAQEQPRLIRPSIVKGLPDILWWDEERWRTGNLKVERID